jgi:ribonuclease R
VPTLTDAPPRVVLLEQRGRFLVGEPFFGRGRRVTVERSRDARPGRLALLRSNARGRRMQIERVLGRPDVARDVIEALMLDRGLRRFFPPGVERAARDAPVADVARRDLTDLPTFTIDPATARDFDDAISCEALGEDHWRVWVHIADVSAHVRPGGAVDREAYRRATSVYVPGAVEPMLPEALSNDACSLRPGVDRLAVTAELELRGAETVKASFHRSVIRSDERLDYDRVDRIFAGEEPAAEPWAGPAGGRPSGSSRAPSSP